MSEYGAPHLVCNCADAFGVTGLEDLDALVNTGTDQRTASLMLWAPERLPRVMQVEQARADAVAIVRRGMASVLAWLHAAGVSA